MDAIDVLQDVAEQLQRRATAEYEYLQDEELYQARYAVIEEIWRAADRLKDRLYGEIPF